MLARILIYEVEKGSLNVYSQIGLEYEAQVSYTVLADIIVILDTELSC